MCLWSGFTPVQPMIVGLKNGERYCPCALMLLIATLSLKKIEGCSWSTAQDRVLFLAADTGPYSTDWTGFVLLASEDFILQVNTLLYMFQCPHDNFVLGPSLNHSYCVLKITVYVPVELWDNSHHSLYSQNFYSLMSQRVQIKMNEPPRITQGIW